MIAFTTLNIGIIMDKKPKLFFRPRIQGDNPVCFSLVFDEPFFPYRETILTVSPTREHASSPLSYDAYYNNFMSPKITYD